VEDASSTTAQKLLADRMGVKVHKEKKEMAVYVMSLAKGGPKFKETDGDGPMTATPEKATMSIKGVSLFELAAEFSGKVLDRPVIDQTGLKGRYDVRLDMSPNAGRESRRR
jgi:bla regulator protein blaR1